VAITDNTVTATSELSVTNGDGGPVFVDIIPAGNKAYIMGKVGIGALNPVNALDVEGAMAVGASYSGSLSAPANGLIVEGNVGVGTGTPGAKLDVAGTLRASQDAYLALSSGKVGIGVAAPAEKLDVAGSVKATGFKGDGSALTGVNDPTKVSKGGDTMTGALNLPANGLVVGANQLVVTGGNVGIGISSPENAEGWSKVIDVLSVKATKLSVRTPNIDARVCAHDAGWWGAPAGMIIGTKTNHPLSLGTNSNVRLVIDQAGNVGIRGNLSVTGSVSAPNIVSFQNGVEGVDTHTTFFKTGTGDRHIDHPISFPRPFASPPQVVVGLAEFDIENSANSRLGVSPVNVTNVGFTLRLSTWADTKIWSVACSWFAYGH